jgi:hypothetical protein
VSGTTGFGWESIQDGISNLYANFTKSTSFTLYALLGVMHIIKRTVKKVVGYERMELPSFLCCNNRTFWNKIV